MTPADKDTLRICAFCPNPCRRALPASYPVQIETYTPSALALLAVLLDDGAVQLSTEVAQTLDSLQVAEQCRPACVYGFDIPALIRRVRQEALAQ
jgi:hypothetical protein